MVASGVTGLIEPEEDFGEDEECKYPGRVVIPHPN